MDILLLHDTVSATARPDAQDTLNQAMAVHAALTELGHAAEILAISNDLGALVERLTASRPGLIFNLVESLAGSDATAVAVPALLDGLGVRYTGSRAASLALSNDKCAAKDFMSRLSLPTPEWVTLDKATAAFRSDHYIVKARFEHASKDLEDDAIVYCDSLDAARRAVREKSRAMGRPCFAERFIRGREFNLSVLTGPVEPEVLAPAEIDFSAFPAGKAHMVGYRAKWVEDSFEFANTPRCFDFAPSDARLLARLEELARTTFEAMGLSGYARVDFRVDAEGPWILEVNSNPCISPDAGFAAALAQSGIRYKDAIARIVRAALHDAGS
jgi:D-alanine-D-alanine ligase